MLTTNDFNSSNINIPTSNIKVDMTKIKPEILEDIKGFKLGDPSIESYKGSYIKTMLNEVGIKVPTAMNYVSEVRPDMSFTTTKDLTRQQYASISNALQKLRSIDVTSVNNTNYSIPIGNYQYVKSNNVNINELRRTASMYLNNTAKSNNIIKLLEKIIKDKNYIIRFNPNITNEQGVSVNGLIKKENGKTIIELNPNADNYVEFLVIHEITHDIATKEMKELILDYAKQDSEFEKSLESLKERYKTNDVSDEVVADVCAELFGNREFIQSVVENKPSIFKKILNNIRKLAEKIKGSGASEYVSFVEELKTMWEDAYRNITNEQAVSNLNETKYSIIEIKGQKQDYGIGVLLDTNIFDGVKPRYWGNIINEYVYTHLAGTTIDVVNENGELEQISFARKNDRVQKDNAKNSHRVIDKLARTNTNNNTRNLSIIQVNEVLQSSKKIDSNNDNSHQWLDKNGWEIKKTYLQDINGNIYETVLSIAKAEDGRRILYDISPKKIDIKKVDSGEVNSIKGSQSIKSTFMNDNIPQSKQNVKSDILPTKYSMQENLNNTQELDNSSFSNIANNQNLEYNTINEAIKADPRKETYAKYNTSVEFFNLEYDRMKKAISIGSKYVLEAQQMELDSYSFSDDKYIYDFDILNKNNNAFGITNVETIYNDVRSDTDERIEKQDNGLSNGSTIYESRYNNSNIKSIENGTTSNNILKLPTREQGRQRSNENRQIIENEKKNSRRELDNSSFSLKHKQNEIIQKYNPVDDTNSHHTWIRNVEDIKTLEETINDSDWSDYDEYNPDLSRQDIENAIDSGKITVYSSYPIKQGISSFDTRLVSFYDGKNAYDLTFSIAKLNDGQYVAYAKRNLDSNMELLNKIKKEMPTSKSRLTSLSENNIPQSKQNVKSDISSTTKYSMPIGKDNTLNNNSTSEIIRSCINEAIEDVGENGRFDIDNKNDEELYNQIWSEYEKEIAKTLNESMIDDKTVVMQKNGLIQY